MLTVSHAQLNAFLDAKSCCGDADYADYLAETDMNGENGLLSRDDWNALLTMDLKEVLRAQEMSADHIGGDDVIGVVDDTLAAVKEGYEITTWYGPKTEAMVIGYRKHQLTILEQE